MILYYSSLQTGTTLEITPNIATGGTADQSSSLGPDYGAYSAIDGNLGNDLDAGATCAITGVPRRSTWWQLDLSQEYTIEAIAITARIYEGKH